jgi:hypothetical protein
MADENQFAVVLLDSLSWPGWVDIPARRFRLFVAADSTRNSVDEISHFSEAALTRGMVYFCGWGPGCERFHDIVDEVIVGDDVFGRNRFRPPTTHDTVMTTWHDGDTLEGALDFLATFAVPSEGYLAGSNYRLVVCVGHPEWAATATRFLKAAAYLSDTA